MGVPWSGSEQIVDPMTYLLTDQVVAIVYSLLYYQNQNDKLLFYFKFRNLDCAARVTHTS